MLEHSLATRRRHQSRPTYKERSGSRSRAGAPAHCDAREEGVVAIVDSSVDDASDEPVPASAAFPAPNDPRCPAPGLASAPPSASLPSPTDFCGENSCSPDPDAPVAPTRILGPTDELARSVTPSSGTLTTDGGPGKRPLPLPVPLPLPLPLPLPDPGGRSLARRLARGCRTGPRGVRLSPSPSSPPLRSSAPVRGESGGADATVPDRSVRSAPRAPAAAPA
mmetsp:Transcript_26091/g.83945  ORF Transcript_26091/g.83945 Transcript_26091/m.83945 type:complete len:222 (-) Transcript_26091:214-879(-)